MEHKPLFGDLITAHDGLAEEPKSVDVASGLVLLMHHAGCLPVPRGKWRTRLVVNCFDGVRLAVGLGASDSAYGKK